MNDGFNIHLASNVSPDLFPENEPAKFSTILANEIDVSAGKWEVAVRQIMYPTHVATTSHDDTISVYKYKKAHRDILPHPTMNSKDLSETSVHIHIKQENLPPIVPPQGRIDFLLKEFNENKWAKEKGFLKLEYMAAKNKFTIFIYFPDTLLILSKELATLLGFEETMLSHGYHQAPNRFKNKQEGLDKSKLDLYLFDITFLERETYSLQNSVVLSSPSIHIYSVQVDREFKDTVPDEYWDSPKIEFTVNPQKGEIRSRCLSSTFAQFRQHEKKIKFFSFDKKTVEKYKLKPIYSYGENFRIKFPQVKEDKLAPISLTLYYEMAKEYYENVLEKPIKVFSPDMKEFTSNPQKLITPLNRFSALGYKFIYNEETRRFSLTTEKDTAVKMSKSMASILGYVTNNDEVLQTRNKTEQADELPIMDRNISALYVYTNIIESVHVGDVKAPLLLVCPLNGRHEKDNVYRMEFRNPTYAPINHTKLRQIDIGIYDDAGALVPFLFGKSTLTLHFRKRVNV